MIEYTRRDLVRSVVASPLLVASGCLDRSGGIGSEDGQGDAGSGTVDASVETTGSDCGSPADDAVAIDFGAESITVEGVLQAPNPCHEAVIEDVALDDRWLSLAIDVVDTTADDEDCVQCHGKVEYVARIEPDDVSTVDGVRVDHVTGHVHTVARVAG